MTRILCVVTCDDNDEPNTPFSCIGPDRLLEAANRVAENPRAVAHMTGGDLLRALINGATKTDGQ